MPKSPLDYVCERQDDVDPGRLHVASRLRSCLCPRTAVSLAASPGLHPPQPHFVEPRIGGNRDCNVRHESFNTQHFRKVWKGTFKRSQNSHPVFLVSRRGGSIHVVPAASLHRIQTMGKQVQPITMRHGIKCHIAAAHLVACTGIVHRMRQFAAALTCVC